MEIQARYNNIVTHLAVLKKIARSGMRKQYNEIYCNMRLRVLKLTETNTVQHINIHTWEIIILRYFPFLYTICISLFDKIQTMKRRFYAQKHKSNK